MAPLRIIQIGTAPMVHSAHAAAALRGLPETFQLEGIVEEDPELLRRAAGNSAFAGLPFLSWEEVLRRRPDALVIETDEHRLVADAIRSLEAGFHTYMDKPGSEDQEEFRRMCRLAAKKNLVLSLGYMFRHNPAVLQALELKRAGKLGEIFSVEAQMSCCNDAGYHRTLPRFRGGMMYYLGCHMIDMVVHFCGFPEEVIPLNARTRSRGVECVDYGFCAYRYPNGVSFVKTCASEINGVNRRSIVINGTKGSFEIRPIEVQSHSGQLPPVLRRERAPHLSSAQTVRRTLSQLRPLHPQRGGESVHSGVRRETARAHSALLPVTPGEPVLSATVRRTIARRKHDFGSPRPPFQLELPQKREK